MAAAAVDLATTEASERSKGGALALGSALGILALLGIAFARLHGPIVPAFLPAIYSAAILAYAVTAFLFANQYVASRSPGFAILGVAYTFAAAVTLPYLLSYPGVFAPHGLIGRGRGDSAGWLYFIEHVGFLGLIIVYALAEMRSELRGRVRDGSLRFVMTVGLATAIATIAALTIALTSADLPPTVVEMHFTPVNQFVLAPLGIALAGVAEVALLMVLRRGGKTIPLWMTVVVIASGCELLLSTAGAGRYTAGWYFSRIEAAFGAGVMLCMFLYYINIALMQQARSMQLLATARDAAERASAEKEALLREYVREQRVARTFQSAALPTSLPSVPGIAFDGFYEPGRNEALVGGDWFDALRLPDGRIVISIGDVAGSGLDAAVIMANMRQVIRGIAHVHTDPAMILEAADRVLRAEHPERFVTAFVALYEPVFHMLTYATAGHNRPLRRDPSGLVTELLGEGLPLGLRSRADAHHIAIEVTPGTLFVFYTDGLIESTHDYAEGERRLRAALSDPAALAEPRLARRLHDRVLEDGSRDDVAILTMRIDATDGSAVSRWSFHSSDASAAGGVRDDIERLLAARGIVHDDCVAAAVVFGELVGNVVRYAPGQVDVVLDATSAAPVLHVLDQGPGFSRLPELPRSIFSENGRGLYIVATLAEDFAVTRRERQGSHARVVLSVRSARGLHHRTESSAWPPEAERRGLIERIVDR
jgi:serine phosphatase RsbU (regulator of sigma subunit)/anti-sigma regulatory factor (Ser/Thr protein kinase)